MANGIVERGELYWVKLGDSVGSEESVGRPGVIVSSRKGNETSPIVQIAYTTTQVKYGVINPSTYASGRKTWILCNQIQTVDKSRLERYLGKLTSEEMKAVDDALEIVLDLGYKDDEEVERLKSEIESLKSEIVELTGEVAREQAKREDELLSYKVENAMWQKCYDKVLNQLVDMKVSGDIGRRVPIKVEVPKQPELPEEPKEPENPPVVEPVQDDRVVHDERVDINHCTQTQLKKVGMSDALARAVVAKRPFDSVADLKNVQGMNKKKFQIWEPKLTCTPLEIIVLDTEPAVEVAEVVETEVVTEAEGKVNINTVSALELVEKLGMGTATAYAITGYRKKNGPYAKVEDLVNAPRITMHMVERIRDKIHCGSDTVEEPYTGPKVNINTATAAEIHEITGLDKTVCFSITGCRKRDGLYRSVEDVRNIPKFKDYHWLKYGKMFEV